MKLSPALTILLTAAAGISMVAQPSYSQDAKGPMMDHTTTAPADASYEGGRGLITLEGPSGMFLNPTSATLPANAFTAQYCLFTPFNDGDVVGHGTMITYGVTDFLEVGGFGNLIAIDGANDPSAAGPIARLRLFQDDGMMPQVSVGYYGLFGDAGLERNSGFLAAYKRLGISESGPVRSLGFHGGARQTWFDADDKLAGYVGAELQLPLRLYLVGEVTTKDSDFETDVPYSFGVQWRAAGVNISLAGIQTGNLDEPGFYFGIGSGFQF